MATLGMRHAVLWVTDPETSATFYQQALGLEIVHRRGAALFLSSPSSATDHDLGLFPAADGPPTPDGQGRIGLYHIAWEVATLAELVEARERPDPTRGTRR